MLDLSIMGWRRQAPALKELPGHTSQARFALHPEGWCGVSGGRRCKRTQERMEDQGSTLFPLGKAESPPCPQQCWRQQLHLQLSDLSPSLLPLRIKSKALTWESPGGSVVRTPHFHCRGPKVQSGLGKSNCIKSRIKQGKGINAGQNGRGKISPILP